MDYSYQVCEDILEEMGLRGAPVFDNLNENDMKQLLDMLFAIGENFCLSCFAL